MPKPHISEISPSVISKAPSVRRESSVQLLSRLYVDVSTVTFPEPAFLLIFEISLSAFVLERVSSSSLSIPTAPVQTSSADIPSPVSYIANDTKVSKVKLSCL